MTTRRQLLQASATAAMAAATAGCASGTNSRSNRELPNNVRTPAAHDVPTVRLNNGVEMPMLGYGTYRVTTNARATMETALQAGYRFFDTAAYYNTEEPLGDAIRSSGIPRSELFITTKLWIADYGYDQALRAFDTSLAKLKLDRVDLYLLHYPTPRYFDSTVASYRAMERLLQEGRVRAIGVSNFEIAHLRRLSESSQTVPAVNQIEIHPYFKREDQRRAHAELGIVTQAWSPIGGIFTNHPRDPNQITRVLEDSTLDRIAAKYGKSPAQIVLRWHLQNGVVVFPKTTHAYRMNENRRVFDFSLSGEDMVAINALDRQQRGGGNPETFDMDYMRSRAR